MTAEVTDYRDILKARFAEKRRRNAGYSLRAFARDLGLSPSRLSEIFSYKNNLSLRSAVKISKRLGLSKAESEMFCTLVESHGGKKAAIRNRLSARLRTLMSAQGNLLSLDAFNVVSDWYHFAILELTTLPYFRSDTMWIAKKLKISHEEASLAVERLLRIGLLNRDGDRFVACEECASLPEDVQSDAVKKSQSQVLKMAQDALYEQNVGERCYFSVVFPFDVSQLDFAKEKLTKLQLEFRAALRARTGAKNEIYCFSQQFFRIGEPGHVED